MPDPRPCLVLVDDEWIPGQVLAWRRDADGWRALVNYRAPLRQVLFPTVAINDEVAERCVVSYEHWRPASDLRPEG